MRRESLEVHAGRSAVQVAYIIVWVVAMRTEWKGGGGYSSRLRLEVNIGTGIRDRCVWAPADGSEVDVGAAESMALVSWPILESNV